MTQAINPKVTPSQGLRGYKEFIFIGNCNYQSPSPSRKSSSSLTNTQTLDTNAIGNLLTIAQLQTSKQITDQLNSLDLKPGVTVQLTSKTNNGSVVVSHNNRLIGIGATIAQKVIVTSAQ